MSTASSTGAEFSPPTTSGVSFVAGPQTRSVRLLATLEPVTSYSASPRQCSCRGESSVSQVDRSRVRPTTTRWRAA